MRTLRCEPAHDEAHHDHHAHRRRTSAPRRSRRARPRAKAARFLTDDGEILITASENRSQAQNKEACIDRLRSLVAASLIPPKVRRPTNVSKASKARRVDAKSRRGKVKRLRQQRPDHGD